MLIDGTLQRRIRQAAWLHRFRPAVAGPGCRSATHLGLLLRAQGKAWRLSRHPERLRAPVALRFPKNTDLIEHLLGVILAGGTYVCLDPGAGGGDWMPRLRSFGTQLLLHGPDEGPSADQRESAPEILCLKRGFGWPWPGGKRDLSPSADSQPCALVQTSGTSGQPCGVLQESGAVLHHAEWTIASQKIDHRSRLSWVSSPGVAAAHSHLFASLLSGACLCPFEPAREGLAAMTRWMRSERITHLHATPSLLRAWLDSLPDGSEFPDLCSVKLGGEPARSSDARLLQRRLQPKPRLLNGLGMSEATGNIALVEITDRDLADDGLLPVGHPVAGRVVTVETEPGRPAGPGVAGEIVVRDEWISPGYLPAGARDAIRSTERGDTRELRTGDAGCWDAAGRLVHLGRLDRRVRVRGKAVDLAVVEARVSALPAVREVAALPEPNGSGFRVAIVLHESGERNRREMTETIRKLPGVHPARVAFVEQIPRKPNGKRDDSAMLENWPPDEVHSGWTGCEIYLRDAWALALGHRDFSPGDRFADVGGDSLSAMKLAAELGRISQREVGMADLVRYPTVTEQARALETQRLGSKTSRSTHTCFHVDWVNIQTATTGRSAWIHTGGYSNENDLWMAGALMAGLAPEMSLMIARANIEDPWIAAPTNWPELVDPLWEELPNHPRPLLIGGCVGAMVIAELAERLRAAGRTDMDVVLLDPWAPGLTGAANAKHPRQVRQYFKLLKAHAYPDAAVPAHVILAGDDPDFTERKRFWAARVPSEAYLHVVRGDHMTFQREHRDETARVLASIVLAPDHELT